MKYRMQAQNPGTVRHNIETWDRMANHAGAVSQELDDLIMWAGGHERDGGNGRQFVLYCIRRGWITEVTTRVTATAAPAAHPPPSPVSGAEEAIKPLCHEYM